MSAGKKCATLADGDEWGEKAQRWRSRFQAHREAQHGARGVDVEEARPGRSGTPEGAKPIPRSASEVVATSEEHAAHQEGWGASPTQQKERKKESSGDGCGGAVSEGAIRQKEQKKEPSRGDDCQGAVSEGATRQKEQLTRRVVDTTPMQSSKKGSAKAMDKSEEPWEASECDKEGHGIEVAAPPEEEASSKSHPKNVFFARRKKNLLSSRKKREKRGSGEGEGRARGTGEVREVKGASAARNQGRVAREGENGEEPWEDEEDLCGGVRGRMGGGGLRGTMAGGGLRGTMSGEEPWEVEDSEAAPTLICAGGGSSSGGEGDGSTIASPRRNTAPVKNDKDLPAPATKFAEPSCSSTALACGASSSSTALACGPPSSSSLSTAKEERTETERFMGYLADEISFKEEADVLAGCGLKNALAAAEGKFLVEREVGEGAKFSVPPHAGPAGRALDR